MTDRNERVRDAFQDDVLDSSNRDRLWSTMQHRQTRQARRRIIGRAVALCLAAAILAAMWAFLRSPGRQSIGPVFVAADSLSTNTPSEPSMIQESREVVAPNLLPLLEYRSSLRMDITSSESRRDALVKQLEHTTGREHDRVEQELAAVEKQLESNRMAVSVIDRQLMGQEAMPMVYTGIPADVSPQVFQFGSPGIPGEVMWMAGGAGGVLLLGMLSLLVYMRSIARSTRSALSQIEGQVSSQHATLASGIDAIALEVERLGEGQRFMSKVLAGAEGKARLPE